MTTLNRMDELMLWQCVSCWLQLEVGIKKSTKWQPRTKMSAHTRRLPTEQGCNNMVLKKIATRWSSCSIFKDINWTRRSGWNQTRLNTETTGQDDSRFTVHMETRKRAHRARRELSSGALDYETGSQRTCWLVRGVHVTQCRNWMCCTTISTIIQYR